MSEPATTVEPRAGEGPPDLRDGDALRAALPAESVAASIAVSRPSRGVRASRAFAWVLLALAWLAIVAWALQAGFELRAWAWRETAPLRFRYDLGNAMRIGHAVNDNAVALADARARAANAPPTSRPAAPRQAVAPWGDVWAAYLAKYDATLRAVDPGDGRDVPDRAYDIDYPPGRLLAVTAWIRAMRDDPTVDARLDRSGRVFKDEAAWPMLRLNDAHELLAALATFALARRALRDAGRSRPRAIALATLAAILLWLNPAVILLGHGWPQWDTWVLPYAIGAVYFGLSKRWLLAGAAIAVGAMFKGQTLLIAPLLLCWPLWRLDVDAAARFVIGFCFAAAVCVAPWLLATTPAQAWLIGVAVLAIANVALASRPSARRWRSRAAIAISILTAIWVVAPFLATSLVAPMLALAVVAAALPGVWRGRGVAIALVVIAGATFAAGARFEGSFAWLPVGFQTDRYTMLSLGKVANLPTLLGANWNYNVGTPVPWFGDEPIETRTLLRGLVYVGLALLAFAAARAQRRRSANVLIVLPAAWTLIYALLPQMHERYLVWAAATSTLLAARSFAGLLAHLFLTAVQVLCLMFAMIESRRLLFDPTWGVWFRTAQGLVPEVGYAVTLLAIVLIAWSFARDPGPRLNTSKTSPAAP